MNGNVSEVDILELIPQRPPFIMVDRLLHFDRIVTTAEFAVREDNIFLEGDELQPEGLVENIAQTCAARIGYVNLMNKESVRLGFIGAVRNLSILGTPKIGETIETTITVKEEIFQMTLVDAEIRLNGSVIVNAEMKIALSDIVA
ncbi:MAG: pseudouridylate synthase [Bacteroidaceae bacterium]|nr:pseudouridylate synthase [Bacteroidaceae bacterium]